MSRHIGLLAALMASVAVSAEEQFREPMNSDQPEPKPKPPPVNGPIIRVSREVYDEVLKTHTLQQVNAMPYAERRALIEDVTARVAQRQRQSSNDIAAQIREERRRRKAEAWAKRQPKGTHP